MLLLQMVWKPKLITWEYVIFKNRETGKIIGEGFLENGLYHLNYEKFNLNVRRQENLDTFWNRRLGHHSDKILKYICHFSKLDCNNCEMCKLEKYTRLPFHLLNSTSEKPFEWRLAPIESFNGNKYFVIFIDDFSKVINFVTFTKNYKWSIFSFSRVL